MPGKETANDPMANPPDNNIEETQTDKDKVIGALIGLVMSCESHDPQKDTIPLILEGLQAAEEGAEGSREQLQDLVRRIHEEKYTIVPNCRTCISPCGNTSDYDMELIMEKSPREQELIRRLRQTMARAAKKLDPRTADMEAAYPFFIGLAAIHYAQDAEELEETLDSFGKEE